MYSVNLHNRSITHKPSGSKIRCDFLAGPDADWTIDQNYSTKAAKIRNSHGLSQQLAGLFLAKGIHLPKMGCKKTAAAKGSNPGSDSEASAPGEVQDAPESTTQTSTAPGAKLTLNQCSDGKFRLERTSAAELRETEAQKKKHAGHSSQVREASKAPAPKPAKAKATKPENASDSEASEIPATPMPRSRKLRRETCSVAPAQRSPSAPLSTEKQSKPEPPRTRGERHSKAHGVVKPGHPGKSERQSHTEISALRTSRPSSHQDAGNSRSRSRSHSRGHSRSCSPRRNPGRSRSRSSNQSLPCSPHTHHVSKHSPGPGKVYGACAKSKSKPLLSKAPRSTATNSTWEGSGHCSNSDADLDEEENNNANANNDDEGFSEDDGGMLVNR